MNFAIPFISEDLARKMIGKLQLNGLKVSDWFIFGDPDLNHFLLYASIETNVLPLNIFSKVFEVIPRQYLSSFVNKDTGERNCTGVSW